MLTYGMKDSLLAWDIDVVHRK